MSPLEVLTSESQERMLAIVEPSNVDAVLALCEQVGRARDRHRRGHRRRPAGRHLARRDRRRRAARRRSPTTARSTTGPVARPDAEQDALIADTLDDAAATGDRRRAARRRCCGWSPRRSSARGGGSPSSTTGTSSAAPCSRCRTTAASCGSATTPTRGIALALDGNGRFARLDPHDGAQLALAEAYRNVACTGARRSRSPTASTSARPRTRR